MATTTIVEHVVDPLAEVSNEQLLEVVVLALEEAAERSTRYAAAASKKDATAEVVKEGIKFASTAKEMFPMFAKWHLPDYGDRVHAAQEKTEAAIARITKGGGNRG